MFCTSEFEIGTKGWSSYKRSEWGSTFYHYSFSIFNGCLIAGIFNSKSSLESSSPDGGSSFTAAPSSLIKVSVIGLKSNLPASAIAVTVSGEATKSMGIWVAIRSLRKVAIERMDDGVFSFLSANLSHFQYRDHRRWQNFGTNFIKDIDETISFDGKSHQF